MKLFALFLPQFHEVAENNEWWGEGFTEWTNVKKASPLFKGHQQPKLPKNGNFYNLLEKKTVQDQTRMMHEYGVNGMIYYHYWFCGKKLLEKPAENLLSWQDVDQPFFFCWANHSWFKATKNEKRLLIEQRYGTQKDWETHFQYLLPFFQDKRYEKKANKPLFMIFKGDFAEKKEMIAYFDRRCVENGFDGICVMETADTLSAATAREACCKQTEYIFLREPNVSTELYRKRIKYSPALWMLKLRSFLGKRGVRCVPVYDGNKLYDRMVNEEPKGDKTLAHGVFFEWDNTPRHSSRGYVITPPKKEKFFAYMDSVAADDYVVINAWNEWAEGMMLEPTEENGYRYLEWIREWKSTRG